MLLPNIENVLGDISIVSRMNVVHDITRKRRVRGKSVVPGPGESARDVVGVRISSRVK